MSPHVSNLVYRSNKQLQRSLIDRQRTIRHRKLLTTIEFNEYLDLPSPSSNPTRHIRVLSIKSISSYERRAAKHSFVCFSMHLAISPIELRINRAKWSTFAFAESTCKSRQFCTFPLKIAIQLACDRERAVVNSEISKSVFPMRCSLLITSNTTSDTGRPSTGGSEIVARSTRAEYHSTALCHTALRDETQKQAAEPLRHVPVIRRDTPSMNTVSNDKTWSSSSPAKGC